MSWLGPSKAGGHELLFSARSTGGVWSAPKAIVSGTDWFVNDADFPSITAMPDGTLAAHWLGNNEFTRLAAHNVHAVLSGSGNIFVTATDSLDASVPGSGAISYAGNPQDVTKSVTGSGEITAR
jgi:hypothetical protein